VCDTKFQAGYKSLQLIKNQFTAWVTKPILRIFRAPLACLGGYNAAGADNEYNQGIMSDGPVILKNGLPMTPEDIVVELSVPQTSRGQHGGEPVASMHDAF
jgi:hypothetical protein